MFCRELIFSLTLALMLITNASAQESDTSGTTAAVGDNTKARLDHIPLTLVPEAPGSFSLPYRLSNTGSDPLTLQEIKVKYLVSPEGASDNIFDCGNENIEIPPGGELFVTCEFNSKKRIVTFTDLFALLSDWQVLTLTPADYQVFASARLRKNDQSLVSVSNLMVLRLRPTIWQVIAGVALGAFFLALYRVASEAFSTASVGARFIMSLKHFIPYWLTAWISGAMVVFITFRMQDAGFPISVAVNDFYGGIVIGIFGYVATTWLGDKILAGWAKAGSTAASEAEKAGADSAAKTPKEAAPIEPKQ